MAQNIPSYVPQNGLVGWWPFNGNANDESGNGNNGTVNGATLTADRNGKTNSAYNFDGVNNFIQIQALNVSNLSISAWININSWNTPGGLGGIVSTLMGPFYTGYEFRIDNTGITTMVLGGNGSWYSNSDIQSIQLGNWLHLVTSWDGATSKLYINNILVKSLSVPYFANNNFPVMIGTRGNYSNGGWLNGKIDDIGIWNRALTQQEINDLYNALNCTTPISSITPQGATTFCSGGFVNLNANTGNNYTYQWYLNGNAISNATASVYTATQGGSYTVAVSDNGCNATSTPINVTVNNAPSAAVSTSGTTTFCAGNSVVLTAQGSGSYLWSNNATTQSITVTQSGSYSVTVTANGCSSNSQAVNVTVNLNPVASITPSGPTTFCSGGSVSLTASGGGTYQWNTGASSSSITVNQSSTYSVMVTANGCTATASQVVTVNPNPTVSLASPGSFININASAVVLSGSPSGGVYSGSGVGGNMLYPSSAGLGKHSIVYTYTNNFNCVGTAVQYVTVDDTVKCSVSTTDTLYINTNITGLTPPNNTNTIKVYPNPAMDHITLDYGNYILMTGYSVQITNSLGQVVYSAAVNQQSSFVALNSWTGNGLYFVYLLDPQGNTVDIKKIVLQ